MIKEQKKKFWIYTQRNKSFLRLFRLHLQRFNVAMNVDGKNFSILPASLEQKYNSMLQTGLITCRPLAKWAIYVPTMRIQSSQS